MNLLIRQLWVKNLIIFRNLHCLDKRYFNSEMSLYTLLSQIDKYFRVNRSYNELTFFGIYSLQYDFLNGYILTFLINVTIGSQVLTNVIGKNPLNCH